MKPYAISQIAEQVIRVIWMLLDDSSVMKIGSGDYVQAVTQSTFAMAFIGMGASLLVLFITLQRQACSLLFLESKREVKGLTLGLLLIDTDS